MYVQKVSTGKSENGRSESAYIGWIAPLADEHELLLLHISAALICALILATKQAMHFDTCNAKRNP
jgi:hypothetical protein